MGKSSLSTKEFLEMLAGPSSEEKAVDLIKNNANIMSTLRVTSHLGAIVHVLVNSGLVTEETYLKLFENVLEASIKDAAKELYAKTKQWSEEDEEE